MIPELVASFFVACAAAGWLLYSFQREARRRVDYLTRLTDMQTRWNEHAGKQIDLMHLLLRDIEERLQVIESKRWLDMDGNVRRARE